MGEGELLLFHVPDARKEREGERGREVFGAVGGGRLGEGEKCEAAVWRATVVVAFARVTVYSMGLLIEMPRRVKALGTAGRRSAGHAGQG